MRFEIARLAKDIYRAYQLKACREKEIKIKVILF